MPMSGIGEYFYFLMVVVIYGSPIAIFLLILAWRRQRLLKGVRHIALATLVVALLVQTGWNLSLHRADKQYAQKQSALEAYLGAGGLDRHDVLLGSMLGSELHGELKYQRYRFPSLNADPGEQLEISVPPQGVNAVAYLRRVSADTAGNGNATAARLILKPSNVSLNPAVRPNQYFSEYHPNEAPHAYAQHTVILQLHPRQSVLIQAPEDSSAGKWRWLNVMHE